MSRSDVLKLIANTINYIKNKVKRGEEKLSPEEMKLIKEMRNNLNDIIVEDMN